MRPYNKNYQIKKDPLFQQIIIERNLKKNSIKYYHSGLKAYSEYNQMTLQELYNEADQEEEDGIRAKNRTIVKRLRGFRTHLIQEEFATQTIKHYYSAARSFYFHHLIEIPYIPSVKLTQKQVMIDEIPKKHHIIEALEHTNNLKHRAIIYFMASSGTARNEVSSLTIQDFIDATSEYHNGGSFKNILEQLESQDNIIPLFQLTRIKTGYRYYTCCTPEATTHILRYLKTRPLHKIEPEDRLFELTPSATTSFFKRLNRKCKYPTTFFHAHSLRKYHADIIQDWDLINMLQGRKPNHVREAYFKANPSRIKEEYIKHLEDLTLHPTKLVTIESAEVKKLKAELKKERELNDKLRDEFKDIQNDVLVMNETLNNLIQKQSKK